MAGALASTKVSDLDLSLGWFRLDESASTPFGHHPRDLVVLEGSHAFGENFSVGGSYYLLNDDATQNTNYLAGSPRTIPTEMVHTLGLNSQAKFGTTTVNGLGYRFNSNVTIRLAEAYCFLGDYYKGTATGGKTPDNKPKSPRPPGEGQG